MNLILLCFFTVITATACQSNAKQGLDKGALTTPQSGTQDEYFPDPKNDRAKLHFYKAQEKKAEKKAKNNSEVEQEDSNTESDEF